MKKENNIINRKKLSETVYEGLKCIIENDSLKDTFYIDITNPFLLSSYDELHNYRLYSCNFSDYSGFIELNPTKLGAPFLLDYFDNYYENYCSGLVRDYFNFKIIPPKKSAKTALDVVSDFYTFDNKDIISVINPIKTFLNFETAKIKNKVIIEDKIAEDEILDYEISREYHYSLMFILEKSEKYEIEPNKVGYLTKYIQTMHKLKIKAENFFYNRNEEVPDYKQESKFGIKIKEETIIHYLNTVRSGVLGIPTRNGFFIGRKKTDFLNKYDLINFYSNFIMGLIALKFPNMKVVDNTAGLNSSQKIVILPNALP